MANKKPIRIKRSDLLRLAEEAEAEKRKREHLEKCRSDPATFIEYVFERHLAELGTPKLAAHHRDWLDVLQRAVEGKLTKRILLIAPRESWKSTVVTVGFMAWYIGNHPEETNGIASVSSSQAIKFAALVGSCIELNPRWKDVFPHVAPDVERGWSISLGTLYVKRTDMEYAEWAERVALRKDPSLFTAGLRGRGSTGTRISGLAILDDPHDEENSYTELAREQVKRWFKTTWLNLVTDEAVVVTILTRWHYDDLASELQEQKAADGTTLKWYTIEQQAILDDEASYWPQKWPLERLREKEAEIGSLIFACQYQNDPAGLRGMLLKDEWLIPFPHGQIDATWPCYYGIDFAITDEEVGLARSGARDPDYTTIARYRRSPLAGPILDEVFRCRLPFPEALRWAVRHIEADKPGKTVVEITGIGQAYLAMMHEAGLKCTEHHSAKNKTVRFQLMSVHFENGTVKVSDAVTPGLLAFRQEWLGFPSAGHDDTLSAAEQGMIAAGVRPGGQAAGQSEYRPAIAEVTEVNVYG